MHEIWIVQERVVYTRVIPLSIIVWVQNYGKSSLTTSHCSLFLSCSYCFGILLASGALT